MRPLQMAESMELRMALLLKHLWEIGFKIHRIEMTGLRGGGERPRRARSKRTFGETGDRTTSSRSIFGMARAEGSPRPPSLDSALQQRHLFLTMTKYRMIFQFSLKGSLICVMQIGPLEVQDEVAGSTKGKRKKRKKEVVIEWAIDAPVTKHADES